jgi:dUTP pyrophosphatase
MHLLKIKILEDCPNREFVQEFYRNKTQKISYENDCGIDIIFPDEEIFITNNVTKCDMGIACEFIPDGQTISGPFILVARSSISNTPLMLANAMGIFDPQYRGPIITAFRCFCDRAHPSTINDAFYRVNKGDRLVQIIAFDGKPIRVEIVDNLTTTKRGSNGFGSTNTN